MSKENSQDFEFDLEVGFPGSSAGTSDSRALESRTVDSEIRSADDQDTLKERDPLKRLLAEPKLPDLRKKDRARLQMQSPNRIHFYWSVRKNPYAVLDKALGSHTSSYTLVARLHNLTSGDEQIFPIDPRGNWWFDVNADATYRAEIGFYAPNRPYIRIAYSNELRTPRKTPSNRTDYTPSFNLTADQFAQTLEAAGYKRDAFDVALAGDDPDIAEISTVRSFEILTGKSTKGEMSGFETDLRFVMLALAAGHSLEEIKDHIEPGLFDLIEKDLAGVSGKSALSALEKHFDLVAEEIEEFAETGSAVFGASLVNFPRKIKKRRLPRSLVPKMDELGKKFFAGSPVRLP
ncbi:MAG: DUF4912 domain-containing protein [Pyrinomonadaceae bacterium]|nr:DUF4912 domain-containing protein [Pyrinomonadaceae bacterium]